MARLTASQAGTLADWWIEIYAAAKENYTATQTIQIVSQVAEDRDINLAFADYTNIATLYGFARRMINAAGEATSALDSATIGPEHQGIPPWARDQQEMNTAPIWHVTYSLTTIDADGNLSSDYKTSVFKVIFPGTIGELKDAIDSDGQALAAKYRLTFVSTSLEQILTV